MKQFLSGETPVFFSKKDGSFDFEFLLPEYLPNISRIVKTSVNTEKISTREENSETVMDIHLKINIIYVSDYEGKIKNASFRETTTLYMGKDIENSEGILIIPSAFVSSCTSKPLTPRKIHFSCSCHGSINVLKDFRHELFDEDTSENIYTLKQHLEYCKKTTLPEISFEHEAEISLDNSKPDIGEIVHVDAVFCRADCSVSENRLDFEGEFLIHLLYETSGENQDNSTYTVVTAPIHVKDSIESEKVTPEQIPFIYLDVSLVEPSVSFDPYGENKVISLNLKYNASAMLFEKLSCEITRDAFSENKKSEPVISSFNVPAIKGTVSETVHLSEKIRTDTKEISEISDCKARIQSVSMEQSENKVFAVAKCTVEILGTNDLGELMGFDMPIILHVPAANLDSSRTSVNPDVMLYINSCNAAIKEGEIHAEFDIGVRGVITEQMYINAVTELTDNENSYPSKSKDEIIVYYPCSGDNLWGIAKKYAVNPDSIKNANDIENDDISSKHTIIIP